jgi:hypothetical protein
MIAGAWNTESRIGSAPAALWSNRASRGAIPEDWPSGGRAVRIGNSTKLMRRPPMKSLIMAIVQSLVDKPEEVQIKEVIGEHAHVLELRVAKEDLGKVIGKGGAHASAIRTLMAAASGKEKKRYILEIIEF